jgi:hypothetical protein
MVEGGSTRQPLRQLSMLVRGFLNRRGGPHDAAQRSKNVKPETQKLIAVRLRAELEDRLARIFKIDPAELPPLSMSDIVSLLFTLHGDTNSLASAGGTSSAIIKLIGREQFWEQPAEQPDSEPIAPTVN